jgi:hypothetical protein
MIERLLFNARLCWLGDRPFVFKDEWVAFLSWIYFFDLFGWKGGNTVGKGNIESGDGEMAISLPPSRRLASPRLPSSSASTSSLKI